MLDQDQIEILDMAPPETLRLFIRDLESTEPGMSYATFVLATSAPFSRPNATKDAILAYCRSKLSQPQEGP